MAETIKVDIELLEQVFPILMRHLREFGDAEVLLDRDYYWSIPADQIYDVEKPPANLDIGQISECLDWLSALADDPERALTYHLVWLGDVLRAVGQAKVR